MGAMEMTAAKLAFLFAVTTASPAHTILELNNQCTLQTCTVTCFPDTWQSDLCVFYLRLAEWASTAQNCGIILEPIPQWNITQTPSLQWEQARASWRILVGAWQQQAAETGLTGADATSSGSGDIGIDEDQSQQTIQMTWITDMQAWGRDYATWTAHEESLNNPTAFPPSSGDQIIPRFLTLETAAAVRSNSNQWSNLIEDWKNITDAYTQTYEELCPTQQQQ